MDSSAYLKDVANDKTFWFFNGITVRNIYELVKEIMVLKDADFKYHCNNDHDDFANWIGGAIGDIELSTHLRKIKNKNLYIKIIEKRIKNLEHQKVRLELKRIVEEKTGSFINRHYRIIIGALLIVVICLAIASIILSSTSIENTNVIKDKMYYLEQRDACFSNYFTNELTQTKEMVSKSSYGIDNACVFNFTLQPDYVSRDFEETPGQIGLDSILADNHTVYIILNNSFVSVFSNSSSMLPTINHNSKAIEIKPVLNDLHVGDIISYRSGPDLIIHRIIEIGNDSTGFYALTKGDNNGVVDPMKIRYSDISGKVLIIIY